MPDWTEERWNMIASSNLKHLGVIKENLYPDIWILCLSSSKQEYVEIKVFSFFIVSWFAWLNGRTMKIWLLPLNFENFACDKMWSIPTFSNFVSVFQQIWRNILRGKFSFFRSYGLPDWMAERWKHDCFHSILKIWAVAKYKSLPIFLNFVSIF